MPRSRRLRPTQPEQGAFVGVTTGLKTPLPWQTNENPALDRFMLPGSAEWSPNAVKARAAVNIATSGPASDPGMMPGGGGGGGHRGGGGGGGFSFAPTNYSDGSRYNAQGYRPDGRRQILGGQSRDSSGLDDYYAMNAMPAASPEERNAAVDALNAGGQTAGFGGYGTTPEGTMPRKRFAKGGYLPAGEPGIVADAGTELAVPHDGTRPELLPAVPNAPGGYEFTPSKDVTILPSPVVKRLPQLMPVPMPTAPSPVWLGPADLTPRSTGIASPEMRPRRGWASGALPSPLMASGEMAPFQGPQPMNFAATPAAPMPVPTKQGFADALMNAPSPDGRPAGVKPTDWKRFMKSPQGMGFAMDQQQGQQRFGQMMALEDQRYQRARQDKLADMTAEQRAAQMEKDRDADALTAGYDLMLKDYAGKGHLSPDQLAVFGAAKDPKTRAMMGKVLAGMAEMNMTAAAEKAKQEQMLAPPVPLGEVPGTGQIAVRVGNETRMVQKAPTEAQPQLVQLPDGAFAFQKPGSVPDMTAVYEASVGADGKPSFKLRTAPKPESVITDPMSLQAAAVERDPKTGKALGLRKLSDVQNAQPAESAKSPAQQNADDIKRLLGGK